MEILGVMKRRELVYNADEVSYQLCSVPTEKIVA
jgi:hypothetical protein